MGEWKHSVSWEIATVKNIAIQKINYKTAAATMRHKVYDEG
jgi:hypothetical protein